MANYPQVMHRGCCVADEGNDQIYCMGGYYHRNAYQYIVSTNTWQSMSWDSSMYYSSYDIGCAIITRKGDGNRIIIAAGSHRSSTQYIDITAGSQWKSSGGVTSWNRGRLISVSPYEAYMVSHRRNNTPKLLSRLVATPPTMVPQPVIGFCGTHRTTSSRMRLFTCETPTLAGTGPGSRRTPLSSDSALSYRQT